jgi:hypothetical protein
MWLFAIARTTVLPTGTLDDMDTTLVVQPDPHWFKGWFLRLCARPVVRVHGVEHAAWWGRPSFITVPAGDHRVAVGARYRGTRPLLGTIDTRVTVKPAGRVVLRARNGHQPFAVAVAVGSP